MSPNSSKNRNASTPKWIYFLGIGITLILAIFLRVWLLDRIPTGIVSDELDYVLNAKAIYHTGGSILTDRWSPWSLTTVPGEIPKAEFPYVVSIPFVGPFGLSLFTARIGYAIVSLLYVGILVGIAATLFGPWAGLATGFLAAVNPWSVYYGRTAYDVPVAITAYMLALLSLLRLRGPYLLLTLIPLCIAFYSYIGTKVLFLPFVIVAVLGAWYIVHKRKDTRWFVIITLAAILLVTNYILHLRSLDASVRVNQLFTPFDQTVISAVDGQRRLTLASPLTNLFANKPVVYLKEVTTKFFGAFSPSILFTNGEGIATFSLWEHGLFYPLDALFLFIALAALLGTASPLLLFFTGIIVIATLPSVLSTVGTTYVHRSSLMYPIFTILMGYGIVICIRWARGRWRPLVIVALVACYSLLVANFTYLYFFRFPYYNSESFGLSQRIYSRYMALANAHGMPVTNVSVSSVGYFRNYLFYNNIPDKKTVPAIRNAFATQHFIWDHAEFSKTCPATAEIETGTTAYILSDASPCKQLFVGRPTVVIATLSDGGALYMIFNDRLCKNYALSPYPTGFTMADFAVEKLSEKQFCERFITRYTQPLYLPQPQKN